MNTTCSIIPAMEGESGPVGHLAAQLEWIRQLQAIAQNGLTYAKDQYDIERYAAVRRIASEMAARLSSGSVETVARLFEDERGHATPKIDVRGAVFRGDEILLVRERVDNRWTLPGGWADVGESPSESVAPSCERNR